MGGPPVEKVGKGALGPLLPLPMLTWQYMHMHTGWNVHVHVCSVALSLWNPTFVNKLAPSVGFPWIHRFWVNYSWGRGVNAQGSDSVGSLETWSRSLNHLETFFWGLGLSLGLILPDSLSLEGWSWSREGWSRSQMGRSRVSHPRLAKTMTEMQKCASTLSLMLCLEHVRHGIHNKEWNQSWNGVGKSLNWFQRFKPILG